MSGTKKVTYFIQFLCIYFDSSRVSGPYPQVTRDANGISKYSHTGIFSSFYNPLPASYNSTHVSIINEQLSSTSKATGTALVTARSKLEKKRKKKRKYASVNASPEITKVSTHRKPCVYEDIHVYARLYTSQRLTIRILHTRGVQRGSFIGRHFRTKSRTHHATEDMR